VTWFAGLRDEASAFVEDRGLRPAAKELGVPVGQLRSLIDGRNPHADTLESIAAGLRWVVECNPAEATRASARRPPETPIRRSPRSCAELDPRSLRTLKMCARDLFSVLAQFDVESGVGWGPPDEDGLHSVGDGWFKLDWMARQGANAKHCGGGEMRGREMEPTILDGSAILVDRDRDQPVNGRIYMVRVSGGPVVRRLRRRRGRGWSMHGDHPLCPVEKLPPPPGAVVVGQVLWSAREHLDDVGPLRSVQFDESALRENLATVVSLLRGLTRNERTFLLEAARGMSVDELLRVGLNASHAMLESAKEPA